MSFLSSLHRDIRCRIWGRYLNKFDHWMVYCAARFRTDKKFRKYLDKHKLTKRFAKQLVIHGYIALIRHYLIPPTYSAIKLAARRGRTNVLKWYSRQYDINKLYTGPGLYVQAANHLDTLKWLKRTDRWWDYRAINCAARLGNIETLDWLHRGGGKKECRCSRGELTMSTSALAAGGGSIPMLEYLMKHNCPFGASAYTHAVKHNHFEVVKWLFAHQIPHYGLAVDVAAYGRTRIAEWLWNSPHQIHITPLTICHAAIHGHVDIIAFVHGKGVEIPEIAYDYAAREGHLCVIQWLHSAGITWIVDNVVAAAVLKTKISKWLYRNGVRYRNWDRFARDCNNAKLARWLRDRV